MKLTRRVLNLAAKDCDFKYPAVNQKLVKDMVDLMRKSKGIGLSAPQVGIRKRFFVMEVDDRIYYCFNPNILNYSDETEILNEGCLSFPQEQCTIERSKEILVRYYDPCGIATEEKLTGIAARCFQHEFDHLDGITMHKRNLNAK